LQNIWGQGEYKSVLSFYLNKADKEMNCKDRDTVTAGVKVEAEAFL
jgi:hypothetical protein